jgi:DnaK suppressor protein
LREVREELGAEKTRLLEEIATAEEGLADLIRDSGDGAGDDQADAGSKTFEREHEMSLANNARDMLDQVEHALARISDGSYGVCESCGKPIGKFRLAGLPSGDAVPLVQGSRRALLVHWPVGLVDCARRLQRDAILAAEFS